MYFFGHKCANISRKGEWERRLYDAKNPAFLPGFLISGTY
jgi:hypothetical protein